MNGNAELNYVKSDGTEQVVNAYNLGKNMKVGFLVEMMSNWANNFSFNPAGLGKEFSDYLQRHHRTIQGCIINFLLGILVAYGTTEYFDDRNATAVKTCQVIREMVKNDEIYFQPLI